MKFGKAVLIFCVFSLIGETVALTSKTSRGVIPFSALRTKGVFVKQPEKEDSLMERVLDLILLDVELPEEDLSWFSWLMGRKVLTRSQRRRARVERTVKVLRRESLKLGIALACFTILINVARILRETKRTLMRVIYVMFMMCMGVFLYAAMIYSSIKRFSVRNYRLVRTRIHIIRHSKSRTRVKPGTPEARKVAHRKYVEGLESYTRHSTILVEDRFRSLKKRLVKYPQVKSDVDELGEMANRAIEMGWEAEEALVLKMERIEDRLKIAEEEEDVVRMVRRCVRSAPGSDRVLIVS